MVILIQDIAKKENIDLFDETTVAITEKAEGSPRKALVLLNSILNIEDEEEQLKIIQSSDEKHLAIEIAKALFKPGTKWKTVAKLLKQVEEDPETIRSIILGYANTVLLGGESLAPRAYEIIDAFRDNFFESRKAGLSAACYEFFK